MLKKDGTFIKPVKVTEQAAKEFFLLVPSFNFGFMQDVLNFFDILEKKKIPVEVAFGAIRFRQQVSDAQWNSRIKQRNIWLKKAKKCPNCGKILKLSNINTPEGPANKKGYKSVWYCTSGWGQDDPEKMCGYHSYSILSTNKIIKKMGIKQQER